jgi:hypothetical protein
MRNFRLIFVALATICVVAFGVFAIVNRPPESGDDVIIIKGGSLEIQCGKNHGLDCLGTPDANGKYKAKKNAAHIMQIDVKDSSGVLLTKTFTASNQPTIEITYK